MAATEISKFTTHVCFNAKVVKSHSNDQLSYPDLSYGTDEIKHYSAKALEL